MFKELKNHLSSLVGFVMPARPAYFFKERFPTSGNDRQSLGTEFAMNMVTLI
jgi:hypothetical protein